MLVMLPAVVEVELEDLGDELACGRSAQNRPRSTVRP